MITGDWFTIEGLRARGYLSPETIANLLRPAPDHRRCRWYPEPCVWKGSGPPPTCSTPDGCRRVWMTGFNHWGWLVFRKHVFQAHHFWTHEPREPGAMVPLD